MDDSGTSRSLQSSLLLRAQEGDSQAWQRIVAVFGTFVIRTLQSNQVPRDDISDLVQDVFVKLHRNINSFHRDLPTATFRGWLYRIARNVANDYFRERAGDPERVEHPSEIAEPDLGSESPDERLQFIFHVLEAIKGDFLPNTFQCFWRCEIDGVDTGTLMDELGMKRSAVVEARRRVWKRLREECRQLLGIDLDTNVFPS